MTTYYVQQLSNGTTIISDLAREPDLGPLPFWYKIFLLILLTPLWYLFLPLWVPVLLVGFWLVQAYLRLQPDESVTD